MCSRIWNISVLRRGSSGWRVQPLPQPEGLLDICECVPLVFRDPVLSTVVNVPGKHLMARTSKHLLALRRLQSSSSSSQAGFRKYIVSYCQRFIGISVYRYSILAVSKWPLFTYNIPTASTSTDTTESETANDPVNIMSPTYELSTTLVPESFALPLGLELFTPSLPALTLTPESPTLLLGREPSALS